jgi:RNA polymerase sigma-70 factor, ECF subfamily
MALSGVMPNVNTATEAVAEMNSDDAPFDIEAVFRYHYVHVARIIARVVRDPARAEELAVEVFLKLWRHERTHVTGAAGWLYRAALHASLDELRRRTRRIRYEQLLEPLRWNAAPATPEQIHSTSEEQERVRSILAHIERRQAELLVLRSHGFSYGEVANILNLNPTSIGTLVARAQQAFRKEYIKRYGEA